MTDKIHVALWDAETDEEIEGVDFPYIQCVPRVGERIHYWQDGTETNVSTVPVRRDFDVVRVLHDWRFMPGLHGARATHVHAIVLFVKEVPSDG